MVLDVVIARMIQIGHQTFNPCHPFIRFIRDPDSRKKKMSEPLKVCEEMRHG